MGIKAFVSAIGVLSQFGLLSTGIPVCLKIRQQGSTKNVTFFPFLTTCLSSILWTKYGILTDDMAVYVVGILGTVWQSIYLLFYYFYTRKKKLLSLRLLMAFLGVCAILTYIKYYSGDHDTAVYHLGYVASGFSIAVYGSPLISVTNVIKYKSTEFMTFSMCLATFVVSFLWTIYGLLEGDNLFWSLMELVLFWDQCNFFFLYFTLRLRKNLLCMIHHQDLTSLFKKVSRECGWLVVFDQCDFGKLNELLAFKGTEVVNTRNEQLAYFGI